MQSKTNISQTNTNIKRIKNNQKTKIGTKTTVRTFQAKSREISLEKTRTCLRNRKLKRESESLPMAAQNNAIMSHYIMAKIGKTKKKKKEM